MGCALHVWGSDIIALATHLIHRTDITIVRVSMSAEYCSSVLSHKKSFVRFRNRLRDCVASRSEDLLLEQADWVFKQYQRLKLRYGEWENEAENISRANGRSLGFLEEVHACWHAAKDYFVQL